MPKLFWDCCHQLCWFLYPASTGLFVALSEYVIQWLILSEIIKKVYLNYLSTVSFMQWFIHFMLLSHSSNSLFNNIFIPIPFILWDFAEFINFFFKISTCLSSKLVYISALLKPEVELMVIRWDLPVLLSTRPSLQRFVGEDPEILLYIRIVLKNRLTFCR